MYNETDYIWYYLEVFPQLPNDDHDWVNVGVSGRFMDSAVDIRTPIVNAALALTWVKKNLMHLAPLKDHATFTQLSMKPGTIYISIGFPVVEGQNAPNPDCPVSDIITGKHYLMTKTGLQVTETFCQSN